MKVKQLIEILKVFENVGDMDVAIVGYNGVGVKLDKVSIGEYGEVRDFKPVSTPNKILCVEGDIYLNEGDIATEKPEYLCSGDYGYFKNGGCE